MPPAHPWLCHCPLSLPARTQRFLQGPFAPGADLCSRTLAVSPDGKLLFSGGHWDNSLRVTSLAKGKVVGHITRHIGTFSSHNDDDEGLMMPQWVCRTMAGAGDMGAGRGHLPVSHILWPWSELHCRAASPHPKTHLGVVVPSMVGWGQQLIVSLWVSQTLSPACHSTSAASTSFLGPGTPPAWCGRSSSR